jgi:hypothetical protein
MPEQARGVDPIDPGLIDLFDRRGCSLSYGLTPDREEVDVVARAPDGSVRLVQVCVDLQDPATCARELRPLESLREASGAEQLDLVVLDPPHRRLDLPAGVRLIPAVEWLLELG